jgi:hypothetical protein
MADFKDLVGRSRREVQVARLFALLSNPDVTASLGQLAA